MMITHLVDEGLRRANRVLLLDRDHGVALVGTPAEIASAPALQRMYSPLGTGGAPAAPGPETAP
jgi:hypothetical protein